MREIEIRPLQTVAEIRQAEAIQRIAWTMDDLEIIPAHTMHAVEHSGALLLGAFDGEQLAGFVFGVLGTVAKDGVANAAECLKMYSVITGILPAYQRHGVGYQLKLAQRDFVLNIGLGLITWTYDPLESLNGYFNIAKLGVVCCRYLRDFHGEMSGINQGLATDRFEAEWHVASDHVKHRLGESRRPLSLDALLAEGVVIVNEATFNDENLPVPPVKNVVSLPVQVLVEIPADFQAIKQKNFALAQQWRAHTRDLFEQLFQQQYTVVDFVRGPDQGPKRSYYLLTQQDVL